MQVEETEDIPDWITQAEKSLKSNSSFVTQPTIQTVTHKSNDVVCIQAEIEQLEIQCKQIWTKIIQLKSILKSQAKSSVRNNELVRSLQKR